MCHVAIQEAGRYRHTQFQLALASALGQETKTGVPTTQNLIITICQAGVSLRGQHLVKKTFVPIVKR